MGPRFQCRSERRRREVEGHPRNGIDFVEVEGADPTVLRLRLLDATTTGLEPAHFELGGGVRRRGITIVGAAVDAMDAHVWRLTCSEVGDHSTYTLRVLDPTARGFDPALSEVALSFLPFCDVGLDCPRPAPCPPAPRPVPPIDHLARDFASFRRVMLERLSQLRPDWGPRSAVDPMVTLVEALAYEADRLSYRLEVVETESYLGTARHRRSVSRHARLLDYRVHHGAAARAWVQLDVTNDTTWTEGDSPPPVFFVGDSDAPSFTVAQPSFALFADATDLDLHTWGDEDCCLPRGATDAWVDVEGKTVGLSPGDFVLLEQIRDPESLSRADADPSRRHVVRLRAVEPARDPVAERDLLHLTWDDEDALPFPLFLDADLGGEDRALAKVRGNVVLAEHGRPAALDALTPVLRYDDRYELRLPVSALAFGVDADPTASAAGLRAVDARAARPRLSLTDTAASAAQWSAADLLTCGPEDRCFAVEIDTRGEPWIRFGDGSNGAVPLTSDGPTTFDAGLRIGGGQAGNVGAEAIRRAAGVPGNDDVAVRNPLPAWGGADPEPLEAVRRDAPEAYRSPLRAVIPGDYAAAARTASPHVQGAVADARWTGASYALDVAVDLMGGRTLAEAPDVRDAILAQLEARRMLGVTVRLRDATRTPLDLGMVVHLEPWAARAATLEALRVACGSARGADGVPGFFHPDRFSFGDALYLSALVAHIADVPGVCAVQTDPGAPLGEHLRFRRWGHPPGDELAQGVIRPGRGEVLEALSDPNRRERGRIVFHLVGGR